MAANPGTYMVNYFPIVNSGFDMWTTAGYNGAQFQADMVTAASLGFNTLRVQLAARAGSFTFGTPTTAELARLVDFYNRAKTVGMNLHFCCFDYFGGYGSTAGSKTWLGAILGALPDTANIAAIEMQNEQLFGSTLTTYTQGYDSGWTLATTGLNDGAIYREWAKQLLVYMQANYPTVPVCVGAASGGRYFASAPYHIAAAYTAFNGNSWAPDWYSFHPYNAAGIEYSMLTTIAATVGGIANLTLEEIGVETRPIGTQTQAEAYNSQADYIKGMRSACQVLGLPEPAPWALFDAVPSTQYNTGNIYGLFDANGNIKPAGRLYLANPAGSKNLPAPDLNSRMAGNQQLYGATQTLRWRTLQGNAGTDLITGATDPTVTYQGQPMMKLTGSGGQSTAAQWVTEVGSLWPAVSPGQSYTFSCALSASGASGTPRLTISWYKGDGTFIVNSNGPNLTLTTTPTVYSVTGTAPAGAVFSRCTIATPNNAGTIWAGGPTRVGPSPRLAVSAGHWYRK